MLDKLADILEFLFFPLFSWLDRSGLTGNLRFTPLYKMSAAIMAVIIVAYFMSLLLRPLSRNTRRWKGVRYLGRLIMVITAASMTHNIFQSTSFIVGRGRVTGHTLGSNSGFLLVLIFVLYMEIRFYKKN